MHHTVGSWGLDRIDQRALPLDNMYDPEGRDGTNVHVYILDTGIDFGRTDQFGDRLSSGWDFIDGDDDAADCDGHGTHVAGILSGF